MVLKIWYTFYFLYKLLVVFSVLQAQYTIVFTGMFQTTAIFVVNIHEMETSIFRSPWYGAV